MAGPYMTPQLPSGVTLGVSTQTPVPVTTVGQVSTVATIAALRAFIGVPTSIVGTEGYYTVGDGNGCWYDFIPTDQTSSDNGGNVIVDASGNRYYLQALQPLKPGMFGAKGDGATDDSAAFQTLFAYINGIIFNVADVQVPVNGGGKVYATSQPLLLPSQISLRDCCFLALSGANWSGNPYATALGYGTNGILYGNNGLYGVTLDSVYLDANRIANVQCLYLTSAGNLFLSNVNGRHWVATGNGLIFDQGGTANCENLDFQQWVTADAEYNVQANLGGMALGFFNSYDSTFVAGNFAQALYPIYIDPNSNNLRFIGVHVYTGSHNGTPFINPYGVICDGWSIQFADTYLDCCNIIIRNTALSNSGRPQVSIKDTGGLYNAANSTFGSWIQVTTTLANTPLYSLYCEGNRMPGGIPQYNFFTIGAGSWEIDAGFITSPLNTLTGEADLVGPGGSSTTFLDNVNLLGVASITGDVRKQQTNSNTAYLIAIEDTGTVINFNATSVGITLPVTSKNIHFKFFAPNFAPYIIAQAGATLNGVTTSIACLQNRMYDVECGATNEWFISGPGIT
jgi:hypothetical protein